VRLFVAVQPPDDVLAAVAALPRPERPDVRWTSRDQWHVTLRFLGEVDDPAPVAAALDTAPLPPAEAVLGPEVAALGRHVVCVPVAGLDALAAGVVAATASFGDPPDDRPFHGHLTLARIGRRRGGSGGASGRSAARPGDLTGAPFDHRFPVDAVRLIHSRLGPGGARYEDLHIRPLESPSDA